MQSKEFTLLNNKKEILLTEVFRFELGMTWILDWKLSFEFYNFGFFLQIFCRVPVGSLRLANA